VCILVRVSWRYARGVITSDDRLFSRLEAPRLDRVVLEPVTERHAGANAILWYIDVKQNILIYI